MNQICDYNRKEQNNMYFYQATLEEITFDTIKDAVFRQHKPTYLHFNFIDYPDTKTFDKVFEIIEAKRKTLINPYSHGIMNLILDFDTDVSIESMITNTDTIALGIYNHFNQDLFVIAMVFRDNDHRLCSYITISDIEKSKEHTSQNQLPSELLTQIINNSLEEYEIHEIYQNSLYLYNAVDKPLSYDGVFHLKCPLYKKNT